MMKPEEFKSEYNMEKPALETPIVTTCLKGIRARTAQLAFLGAGYNNVRWAQKSRNAIRNKNYSEKKRKVKKKT